MGHIDYNGRYYFLQKEKLKEIKENLVNVLQTDAYASIDISHYCIQENGKIELTTSTIYLSRNVPFSLNEWDVPVTSLAGIVEWIPYVDESALENLKTIEE